jgi:AcrR family transcriptional regulator
MHEVSVADIVREARISRATFYLYFSSKQEVVATLLDRTMDQILLAMTPFEIREDRAEAARELRRTLDSATRLWVAHRGVLRATHEQWHAIPELRAQWSRVIERFVSAVAPQIDRGRRSGVVPPGPDSRRLAAALLWGSDHCFYVGGLGVDRDVPAETELVEALTALWVGGIFGAEDGR